jgi:hypothetical protein
MKTDVLFSYLDVEQIEKQPLLRFSSKYYSKKMNSMNRTVIWNGLSQGVVTILLLGWKLAVSHNGSCAEF